MNRNHLILLAGVTVLALLVAACGSEPSSDDSSTESGTERNVVGDASPGVDEEETVAELLLAVADSDLGPILVDAEGFTLYVLLSSDGDPDACSGSCAEIWPPLAFDPVGELGRGLDPAQIGQAPRADGTTQAVYGGHPLYRYRDDSVPGDVNGQGINDIWFVLDPTGEVVVAVDDPTPADAPATDVSDPFSY